MKASSGFTLVELLMTIVFLGITGTVFFQQHEAVQVVQRDRDRKIAINAIHYNLEEVVKAKLGGYPRTLSAAQLTAMDKSLLKDPRGVAIGASTSEYRYEPTGCNGGDVCTGYVLRANLERETDFVKNNT
jgi:type II secretory pathway pseudopilin PulG